MLILAFLALLMTGCSGHGLILHDTDSVAAQTGKVSARVLLGLVTIGGSEVGIAWKKQDMEDQAWYNSLSREDQLREDARRPQLLLFMQPSNFTPYQIPMSNSRPFVPTSSAPRQPLTCQTYTFGNNVNTTCY